MPQLKVKSAVAVTDVRECHDLHGFHYRLPLMPYEGVDFSRKCFVFPGQSAAQPGMGKSDLQRFEILRKRFAIADGLAAARGLPPPSLFVNDPNKIAADKIPLMQCLALFTMSVGLFELLLLNGERPALVTGHSFGEYAALAASGIASFEDVFDQICERDRVCPPAGQAGVMIAVHADAAVTARALGSLPAVIANTNSPEQTVISLPSAALKEVMAALKREKLAAKHLDSIPQPYHSGLLARAAADLRAYAHGKRYVYRAPRIPMLSSVSGKIITSENFSADTIVDLVAGQLTTPVDFIGQIHAVVDSGCHNFIELAHHKTCTSWIRDILKDAPFKVSVPPVLAPVAVAAVKAGPQYDSKLVGFLNRVISSVTGYSVEDISLAKNFQEDLGIDSIKKAQIVFDFLESQGDFSIDVQDNMVMNQIRTVEDVLAWYMKDKDQAASGGAEPGLFQWHAPEWVESKTNVFDHLLAPKAGKVLWLPLARAAELAAKLENAGGDVVFYDDAGAFVFEEFLASIQTAHDGIMRLPAEATLTLVTHDGSAMEIRALGGFLKSLAYETGRVFRSFHFDKFMLDRDQVIVEEEMRLPFAREIRFDKGRRYALAMVPVAASSKPAAVPIKVAAIGGASGVTLEILKTMIKAGTREIHIVGRRTETPMKSDLDMLRSLGAAVHYVAGDATNRDALEGFLKHATEKGPVDMLLHGGGIEYSALISKQSAEQARAQLDIKIATTRHLIDIARALPIRQVVCFGSLAGEWGNAGQTIYAYANMVMTHLCEQARGQGLAFRTLAWPAWDRVGMTKNDDVYRQILLHGRPFLGIANGCQLFMDALAGGNRLVCFDTRGTKGMDLLTPSAMHGVLPDAADIQPPVHMKHWTLQEMPDIRHHIILGHTVIPITLSLSTFLYLGYFKTGQICRLTDIKAASFMPVHQKDSPYSLNFYPEGTGFRAEMRSNEPHIEAMIVPGGIDDIPIKKFAMPDGVEHIASRNKDYDDCKLEFQITTNTYRGPNGFTCADLDYAKNVRFGSDPIHFLAFIIEGMLQMGGMGIRYMTQGNRNSVPFAMKNLTVNGAARITDSYKVVAYFMQESDDLASNELYAYNADGDVFMHIGGEQVRMWSTHEG